MLDFAGIRIGLIAVALTSAALLSGCGGGDSATASSTESDTVTAVSTTPATEQSLSLSGSPAGSVKVGEAYSFQPTLAGATTGVGFSIQNKPVWANFDTSTGALTGTPGAAHVGSYANIVITVTDEQQASAALAAFSLTVVQVGSASGSATLTWQPPTQNTDGSAISDLAGYRIYHGPSAASLTSSITVSNPGLTAYTVADLGSGTHYFGITAYTTGGIESGISSIGSKTVM